ncbi:hypothetical protein CSA80_05195 [Candidatus Saccharibacteria bacterium]|nr:MAG: hypothetical protein CSA80_05195 [Candidatus Saccharibacteria bacterium]
MLDEGKNKKVATMKQQLDNLMQKEVSRKEFLGMSGLAFVSVFGLGSIVKLLNGHSLLSSKASKGYGSSPYGR